MNLVKSVLLKFYFCEQISCFLNFSDIDLFCWKGRMSSQTTKSNITQMITDSVIDDFAAALVGRLKAEARESQPASQAGREDFFFQLLHDSLKAARWLGALLRNSQGKEKLFFSVCFLLQYLHFNMRMRGRDSMEKTQAAGERKKPDSSKIVQRLHAALFFSSVFLHPWLDHLGTEFINTGWLLCLCSVGTVSQRSKHASAASEQAMVTLRWRVLFALQLLTLLFYGESCSSCQCLVPSSSGDYIHVQISKYNKLKINKYINQP